jgi:transcriptional regulator with XRE-family HTH domain
MAKKTKRRLSKEDAASFKGMAFAVIELREDREISKTDLAKRAEIGISTLREIERGDRDAKWGTLRRLASALEIPLDAMIESADELAPDIGRRARRGQQVQPAK